ncbi:MAG: tRNA (N6-isopentenyl adenosine(37)-C2)-methylthiotransferase MiaB, partial [Sedimentisphaerales bacterium]|nr:tRNA (N6-isopentenyl adenosine(37)-C2)-methylthiotransferase MiaB [Sedimentisphaerales bacterium]
TNIVFYYFFAIISAMQKTFYIETIGCQMNKLDSELVAGNLQNLGYTRVTTTNEASVIIYNTCSVRQHAEDKVLTKISQLKNRHIHKKDFVLAVIGCMAQRLGQTLLDDYPQVTIVTSPSRIYELADLVDIAWQEKLGCPEKKKLSSRIVVLNDNADPHGLERLDSYRDRPEVDHPFMAFVRIMHGCNNFCSYCIVPHVRGREISRQPQHIYDETLRLVDNGVKEITLLGQAVNKYDYSDATGRYLMSDLLYKLHDINGLERLRFVTSYPGNFDRQCIEAMASLEKVCPYLHMPAQSGSDAMLKRMNRHYTISQYYEIIDLAREKVPDISFAGDFICGFSGETDDDHQQTLELIRRVRYKNCFAFKYSVRPGTTAADKYPDDVPEEVKQKRLAEVLALQKEISLEDNSKTTGKRYDVLVEGLSKSPHLAAGIKGMSDQSNPQLTGRTGGDHIVVFNGPASMIGKVVPVEIVNASSLTLFAKTL